jgi:hypothetical protein
MIGNVMTVPVKAWMINFLEAPSKLWMDVVAGLRIVPYPLAHEVHRAADILDRAVDRALDRALNCVERVALFFAVPLWLWLCVKVYEIRRQR